MTGMSLRIVITCLLDNIATLWGGYMLITFGSWRVKVYFSNWGVLCCSYVYLLYSSLNTTYKTLLPRNFWNATKNPRTFIARSMVTDFFTLIGALLNTNWSLIDKGIPPSFLAKIYKIKKTKRKTTQKQNTCKQQGFNFSEKYEYTLSQPFNKPRPNSLLIWN